MGNFIGYNLSSILYVIQKLSTFVAATATITCIIASMITMLTIGIGLGYNYCSVDYQAQLLQNEDLFKNLTNRGKGKYKRSGDAEEADILTEPPQKAPYKKRNQDINLILDKPTDIQDLLSKIRGQDRNITHTIIQPNL